MHPHAMAECVFPEDIMVCILTRLPVKSLVRFKSVCKPWLNLFSNPKFIKMHHHQLSNHPTNQSFLIHSFSDYQAHTMSLFNIDSTEKKPANLDHPFFGVIFLEMDFVGYCYGLACMPCPTLRGIVLWNPALSLYKFVPPSKVDFRVTKMEYQFESFGFGCDDSDGVDFKVVRVVCLKEDKRIGGGVEVYSSNSDTWKTIDVGFEFEVLRKKNDAIVNGNPYWVAKVDGNESAKSSLGEVLVSFDVVKMVFKIVPLSTLNLGEGAKLRLVDWKGSLAAIECVRNRKRIKSFDVWVFDDCDMTWRKNHTFGPVEMKVDRLLQCSVNGKYIVGECPNGTLFVFDVQTGCVKEIEIEEAKKRSFVVHGYTEGLTCLKGMESVDEEGEDGEEEEDDVAGENRGSITSR